MKTVTKNLSNLLLIVNVTFVCCYGLSGIFIDVSKWIYLDIVINSYIYSMCNEIQFTNKNKDDFLSIDKFWVPS